MAAQIDMIFHHFTRVLLVTLLCWLLPLPAAPLQWPVSDEVLGQTAAQIRVRANASAIRIDGVVLAMPAHVSRFYQQREYRPIWVERTGVLIDAGELLQAVKRANSEGLPVQDYPVAAIERYLLGDMEGPAELAKLDLLLTDTFLHYSRNVRSGRLGPRRVGGSWLLPYTPFDGSALLSIALTECSMSKALAELPPIHAGYQRLRAALQQHRAVAAGGGWPKLSPGGTLEIGSKGPRVVELRERLRISGDLHETPVEDPELFDEALSQAVMQFQRRHGIEADGRVGKRALNSLNVPVEATIRQIEANMERWRWLPREMAPHYILVNMAGYELDVIDAGVQVMNMRVIVGRNYRQTPVFSSEVTNVVLNPHWYVPRLIFREDILPALRRDPGRFQRLNMRLLSNGAEVDASHIDWSKVDGYSFPYTLRQEPGPDNALGRIKFLLPNSQGIYLHDTPDRHLFDRSARAFSSGCIRLEQPLELAQYLLANPGQWDTATLQEAIDTENQRTLTLPEPVPIYFTYWTAWVDQDGVLQLREDIYQRDRRLLKLWGENAT
jgi:murein L,D-transpeptidase YcbB/YkuD